MCRDRLPQSGTIGTSWSDPHGGGARAMADKPPRLWGAGTFSDRQTPTKVGLGRKNDRLPIHPHYGGVSWPEERDKPPPGWGISVPVFRSTPTEVGRWLRGAKVALPVLIRQGETPTGVGKCLRDVLAPAWPVIQRLEKPPPKWDPPSPPQVFNVLPTL